MKFHFDGRWLEKETLIDLNIEADFIYSKLFKNIIIKKLKQNIIIFFSILLIIYERPNVKCQIL